MKNLFKNKKIVITVSVALALILIVGTVFCLTRPKKEPEQTSSEPIASETEKNITVEIPDSPEASESEPESTVGEIADDGRGLKPDEVIPETTSKPTGAKADSNVTPVTESIEPIQKSEAEDGAGIQIGGSENDETYSCGCANHHCKNAEAHAYIQNLELEGCPLCGSHSCPSFYGTDEWGNTGYFPTLCPKYNEKSDPLHYCQKCGKKIGDGSGGTCVEFINACNCPLCGEYVEARTCHTCK